MNVDEEAIDDSEATASRKARGDEEGWRRREGIKGERGGRSEGGREKGEVGPGNDHLDVEVRLTGGGSGTAIKIGWKNSGRGVRETGSHKAESFGGSLTVGRPSRVARGELGSVARERIGSTIKRPSSCRPCAPVQEVPVLSHEAAIQSDFSNPVETRSQMHSFRGKRN